MNTKRVLLIVAISVGAAGHCQQCRLTAYLLSYSSINTTSCNTYILIEKLVPCPQQPCSEKVYCTVFCAHVCYADVEPKSKDFSLKSL